MGQSATQSTLACAPVENLRPSQVRHLSGIKAKKHLCRKLGSCLDTVDDKITKRRLEWLWRMPEHRILKMARFGWCLRPANLEGQANDEGIRSARN